MMRKLICMLLCAVMTLALALPGALADNLSLLTESSDTEYHYPRSMVVVGDTLYLLADGANGTELWLWRSGMEEAVRAGDVDNVSRYNDAEEMAYAIASPDETAAASVDPKHALSTLFTDGTRLMSMNSFTGLVFSIEVEEESIHYTDVTTLQDASNVMHVEEDYSYINTCNGAAVVGDKLLYATEDWNERGNVSELHIYSLTDGSHKVSQVEHVVRACAYKEDKLLLQQYDYETAYDGASGTQANVTLAVYDPATDSLSSQTEMSETSPQNMGYSTALDAVLYLSSGRIMGMKDLGEAKQYGYMPLSYCDKLFAIGSSVAAMNYEGVYLRDVSADFSTEDYLNLYGIYDGDGYRLFSSTYPNVPLYTNQLYYNDTEALGQAMVSGDSAMDVLQMTASYEMFFTLMDKGYCADLSGYPELVSYVDSLQPCLKEAVTKDGKLYAIPLDMSSWGWFASKSVMDEMGLTIQDIPTNYVDMCAFLTRWNDEYLDEYPNFLPGDYIEDYKGFMFNQMMNAYLQYCVSQNTEIKFDTPVFREMMAAVEAMRVDDLNRVSQDSMMNDGVYMESLIGTGYQVVGDFSYFPNENGDTKMEMQMLKMTLTKDTPFVCGVDMQVMFINPRSTHMESAVNLIKCEIASLSETQKHTMMPGVTDPVPNAYYDQMVENEKQSIAELEKSLENADDADKKDMQQWLDSEKKYAETIMPKYQYDIWAGQIEAYQTELVPYLFVNRPTFMNASKDNAASELNTLISRYQEGQISLDQFIHDADGKMRMMQMENY